MAASDDKKEPYRPEFFSQFFNKMDRLFAEKPMKGMLQSMDDFFSSSHFDRNFPIEVKETADYYHISASLPGIRRQQIEIELLPNAAAIQVLNENGEIQLQRRVQLSKPIDEKRASARHRDGLLQLTLPKVKGKTVSIHE